MSETEKLPVSPSESEKPSNLHGEEVFSKTKRELSKRLDTIVMRTLPLREDENSTIGFTLDEEKLQHADSKELLRQIESLQRLDDLSWRMRTVLSYMRYELEIKQGKESSDGKKLDQYDRLISVLQPGDILFTYPGKKGNSSLEYWFHRTAAGAQSENFRVTHVGVYVGNGKIAHIQGNGGTVEDLRNLLVNKHYYDGVSVGRFRTSRVKPAQQEIFVAEAQRFAKSITSYNPLGFVTQAAKIAQSNDPTVAQDLANTKRPENSAICWDVVFEACKKAEIQDLGSKVSAPKMFESDDISILYTEKFDAKGEDATGK